MRRDVAGRLLCHSMKASWIGGLDGSPFLGSENGRVLSNGLVVFYNFFH